MSINKMQKIKSLPCFYFQWMTKLHYCGSSDRLSMNLISFWSLFKNFKWEKFLVKKRIFSDIFRKVFDCTKLLNWRCISNWRKSISYATKMDNLSSYYNMLQSNLNSKTQIETLLQLPPTRNRDKIISILKKQNTKWKSHRRGIHLLALSDICLNWFSLSNQWVHWVAIVTVPSIRFFVSLNPEQLSMTRQKSSRRNFFF